MRFLCFACMVTVAWACREQSQEKKFPAPDMPLHQKESTKIALSREEYYDKVLGMLVGSAIGDAMGAPTEMWDRKSIEIQKGYVDSLDVVVRESSPEGPWVTNMRAGGTTDDTRWKYLGIHFLLTQSPDSLNPTDLAKHIVGVYENEMDALGRDKLSYASVEETFTHLTWLVEWVKVARPFAARDMTGYNDRLSRFYGGEMSCAGMLYSPVIGAFYPGMPEQGYEQAFGLSIFDIGYARDITALTSAYVSKAMEPGVRYNDILLVTQNVDPMQYFKSRLIGRLAHQAYSTAKDIVRKSQQLSEHDIPANLRLPTNFKRDKLYFIQQQKAFSLLEQHLQGIPFHAGEIHLINLTALEFSGGDFTKAMEFVANFGRDNDTVGAVTGAIIGAYLGFKKLPPAMSAKALEVNKNAVGIDLETLARDLVDYRFGFQ